MMTAPGVDIVAVERFQGEKSPRFMARCFTPGEREYLADKRPQSMAGLFAAKEAAAKALGSGFRGFWPCDIEIIHDQWGKPRVALHNGAAAIGAGGVSVSISHDGAYAIAYALAEIDAEAIPFPTGDGPPPAVLTDGNIAALLPKRKPVSNKGDYGRVCVVAGCAAMPGAAALCCTAVYRVGAGLADACAAPEVARVIHHHLPEAVTTLLSENDWQEALRGSLSRATVLLLGPGMGQSEWAAEQTAYALDHANLPMVLDADGLNLIAAGGTEQLRRLRAPCVITPHPGEMARLTGLPLAEILRDPLNVARRFAREYGVITLLKGARTCIAHPNGAAYVNVSGCDALAKAGSGDVLAGVIAGLAAQGVDLFPAAAVAAFLHGRAGERAAETFSRCGVLARDVLDALPRVIREMA